MLARLSVLSGFLALIVVVAGCGGGGPSTGGAASGQSTESGETTKVAFVEEADGLCSEYQAEVAPIKAELEELEKVAEPESPQNEKKLGELLNEAIAKAESELESLRELEPPQADSSTIEKMLGTAQEGNALGTEAAAALEEGETQRFGELEQKGQAINTRGRTLAESYGLKVCGQAP